MRQFQQRLTIRTDGPGLIEFTSKAATAVRDAAIANRTAHFFCQHTSASLLIQENADPDVQRDLQAFFECLVPNGDPLFIHTVEGPDDMPAHVKSALTQTALTVPILDNHLALGTWQGLYLFEHRTRPQTRRIIVSMIGE